MAQTQAHLDHFNVLFLCTHNSARSVLAEAIINRLGGGRFKGYSAGSQLSGKVNPFAVGVLEKFNYPTGDVRSKSWDEFAKAGAPKMDFVFTVCDGAAQETCPTWPGQPMTAHWGIPDPSAVEGTDAEKHAAFLDVYGRLYNWISIFVNLPMESLDELSLQKHLDDIGSSAAKDVPESA